MNIKDCSVTPENLAELLLKIESGIINGKIAKTVFSEMFKTGKSATEIIKSMNLEQITDQEVIASYVMNVINENTEAVIKAKSNKKVFTFLIGQVMKQNNKLNPLIVSKIMNEKLGFSV